MNRSRYAIEQEYGPPAENAWRSTARIAILAVTAIAILALVLFDFEKGDVNDRRGDEASDRGGFSATTHPWQGQRL